MPAIRGTILGVCLLFWVATVALGGVRLPAAAMLVDPVVTTQAPETSDAANAEANAPAGEAQAKHETQGDQAGAAVDDHAPADSHASGNPFLNLFSHVLPHLVDLPVLRDIGFYNVNLWQLYVLAFMLVLFLIVRNGLLENLQSGKELSRLQRVFSGFILFIRDEMVRPVLGDEVARKYTPYFLFLFFFIVFQNLAGLLPIPGAATATASIFVTAALATITFAIMLTGGMLAQGPVKFWLNLVPHGLPLFLWPLMFVVEVIGLIVKPFALMIRLFANMTGGHLVVLSFMGLIFYFGNPNMMGNLAYAVAVPSVGMAVFIMIIEGFVALLQAYIFTYLSILFIGMCLHPEH